MATDKKDDDLAREIRAHLELEAEERIADGVPPEEARYAARRVFGNVLRVREDARAVWRPLWLEHLQQDLRYASRALRRSPGFALVAVLALALGIGVTTAVFAVVNAVLIRPLPFPRSDRLVRLLENVPPPPGSSGAVRRTSALTLAELAAFASRTGTVSLVGAYLPAIRTVTGPGEPVRLIGSRVSPAVLSMLETSPLMGRVFDSREDVPGADVVILSYAAWRQRFGADPNILGQRLNLDQKPHSVIGVMGPDFAFPDPRDEFWIPLTPVGPMAAQRLPLIARLQDGVSPAAALAEISTLVPRLRSEPPANRFEVVRVVDTVVAPVKPALVVLAVAVALVLLIASVNVATLLLARTAARRREMAVRLSLGAGRGRLIRQGLTENIFLTLIGGCGGLGLALATLRLFQTLAAGLPRRDLGPGLGIPRLAEIAFDSSVVMFALAVSIVMGILLGLVPTIWLSRPRLSHALRLGAASPESGFNLLAANRAQGVLVIAEIAMAITLFVGAGLLVRTLVNLSRVDPGYDPRNVLTFELALPPGRPDSHLRTLAHTLVERVRSLPGVGSVGYADSLPLTRVGASFVPLRSTPALPRVRRPPGGPITPDNPQVRFVSQDFLTAMRIPLLAGRAFADSDEAGQPQVMLINRTLARSGGLGENPVGKRVYALGENPWEIVGIVEDVSQSSLTEPAAPQVFIDYRQVPAGERMAGVGLYFGIRADAADPRVFAQAIRGLASQADSQAIVENVAPMTDLVVNSISRPRLYAVLLALFAGVAVVLAATGIYGVMAYAVTQRVHEIGIRMALGAGRGSVMRLVLGQGAVLTLCGVVLGLGGAAALTRYLDQLLFGLTSLDPGTFIAVGLTFAAISTLAAFVPARRATKVDPLVALRAE